MQRHIKPAIAKGSGTIDTLVVAFHGCTWTSWRRASQLRHVIDAIRETLPGADVFMPRLPIEFWSLQDPDVFLTEVLAEVDRLWERGSYKRVILVGFSFGSVLIRQLFCRAAGARVDGTVDVSAARSWTAAVARIVLLAGLNRGWTVDSPVSRIESIGNNLGTAIGHLLPVKPTLFAIRRGAPFLTRTRLQWLALERAGLTPRLTIQLLGTQDDIVSPADIIDLATGSKFVYLEVPRSGHFNVIEMSDKTSAGTVRRERFQLALAASQSDVVSHAVPLEELPQLLPTDAFALGDLAPTRMSTNRLDIDDVVFVVHGIRDKGYWTRKIARVVVLKGRDLSRRVVAVAPTYGYFAMLPFFCPWTRRAKVEWLLDMYVSVRSVHPYADVSFIGHSNGTYILAGAVESCPAVHFKNVVFAGSVVRSNFDWTRYISRGQVERVLNYVATADWVVAIFPRFLQRLRLQDLGGAGYDGFASTASSVEDVEYVPGTHDAALDERHWDDIATFALTGTLAAPPVALGKRHPLNVAAAHSAALIWLILFALAAIPMYLLFVALGIPKATVIPLLHEWQTGAVAKLPAWLGAIAVMGWSRLIVAVLTKL